MNSEYIKLSPIELFQGKRTLLESELLFLDLIKQHEAYKKTRNEGIIQKVLVEKKLSQINNTLSNLQKLLPKTSDEISQKPKEKISLSNEARKQLSLNQEIEEIKKKLQMLQSA